MRIGIEKNDGYKDEIKLVGADIRMIYPHYTCFIDIPNFHTY